MAGTVTPDTLRIDVAGAQLGCVRWRGRPGAPVVVAIHGITANAWVWSTVAEMLDGEVVVVAVDLRGRGRSSDASPPFGVRQHADDVAGVIERLGAAPALVTGHSMGAHVALACAERHPHAVSRLVLVDGGTPFERQPDLTLDEILEQMLGPSIARLRTVWPDRVSYHAMWSAHPAFAGELSPTVERYVLSDLVACEGGFRSNVSELAVRTDGQELLSDEDLRGLFERHTQPLTVIRAETGLLATPPPFVAEHFLADYPQHDWRFVSGSNHYNVLLGPVGAAEVVDAIREAVVSSQR